MTERADRAIEEKARRRKKSGVYHVPIRIAKTRNSEAVPQNKPMSTPSPSQLQQHHQPDKKKKTKVKQ